MTAVDIILGVVLVVASIFLIVAVLMQHGKTHNLSGTIAGGAETFFGKSKGQTIDKKLSTATTIIAVVFVLIVLAVYLMQDSGDTSGLHSTYNGDTTTTVATTTASADDDDDDEADTTTSADVTTVADETTVA